eukprot:scaffold23251_cov27-Tisochrysis_lutea.AAC.1
MWFPANGLTLHRNELISGVHLSRVALHESESVFWAPGLCNVLCSLPLLLKMFGDAMVLGDLRGRKRRLHRRNVEHGARERGARSA